ncbi:DUF3606 domain-containing protein [Pedobacter aquatilis]|uniref:DUF3606 domain-containing protein n=1 Tax=Pedobacter aquatilis TaxID=351343 RepID=UPI0025B51C85|nr:DUF3606 domain-containing protein [Pedobacter aquatilis]MDN3585990.1 DUF3606 domain-containing protein [Pedobacter aquatilis]
MDTEYQYKNKEAIPDPEEIRERFPIEEDSDTLEPYDDASEHREINLDDPGELKYWLNEFQISEQTLRDAVAMNGTSARAVKKYLSV